ncbi:MAG: N-acetyltransferase [Proteobacteria bacterium]|nr:N-acetyltransferase [Pseudomonadota bacterium]
MNVPIIHNPSENRFEYRNANDIAVCDYKVIGNMWYFNHTSVPDSMRGQGVAAQLVETALTYVDEQHGRVVANCSYVAAYIKKNPNFAHLVAIE